MYYENLAELVVDIDKFLIYYNFARAYEALRNPWKVKTPFETIENVYKTQPEIFKITPNQFKKYFFDLVGQRGEN